jgi:uncharacterized membrane protein
MNTSGTKIQLFMKLLGVVVVFALGIATTYVWLLPAYFSGYKIYHVLIIGLFAAYMSGAYIGYSNSSNSTVVRRMGFGIVCGLGVAILVLYASMLIILNFKRILG